MQSRTLSTGDFKFDIIQYLLCSDLYEGTRVAAERDLSGIRQILRPLEESGILIKRNDEEVRLLLCIVSYYYTASVFGQSVYSFCLKFPYYHEGVYFYLLEVETDSSHNILFSLSSV